MEKNSMIFKFELMMHGYFKRGNVMYRVVLYLILHFSFLIKSVSHEYLFKQCEDNFSTVTFSSVSLHRRTLKTQLDSRGNRDEQPAKSSVKLVQLAQIGDLLS